MLPSLKRRPVLQYYDRKGKHLAVNKDSIAAFILPKSLEEPKKLKRF